MDGWMALKHFSASSRNNITEKAFPSLLIPDYCFFITSCIKKKPKTSQNVIFKKSLVAFAFTQNSISSVQVTSTSLGTSFLCKLCHVVHLFRSFDTNVLCRAATLNTDAPLTCTIVCLRRVAEMEYTPRHSTLSHGRQLLWEHQGCSQHLTVQQHSDSQIKKERPFVMLPRNTLADLLLL